MWIPNIPAMREAWLSVMLHDLHVINKDDVTCNRCGQAKPCACRPPQDGPRVCAVCHQPKPCSCTLLPQSDPGVTFSDPELSVIANNGDEVDVGRYSSLARALIERGASGAVPFLAAVLAASDEVAADDPMGDFR